MLPLKFDIAALREMFGFSVKAQLANIANGFFEPLSKILIGRFAGMELLGIYEMAYKLVSLPRNAAVSGVQATVPSITRLMITNTTEARRLYKSSVHRVTRAGAALALLSIAASPFVSWFILGGEINTTLFLFVTLIAVGFFINTLGAPAFILGTATGRMRNNILSAVLSLAIMSGTSLVFAPMSSAWVPVLCVALALAFGGLFIKWSNEKLLEG